MVCALLCIASASHSVTSQTNTDAKKAASNAPPVAPPQAVFVQPRTKDEGRDPFYPKSTRPFANAPAPVVVRVDLKLQGISGPPNHRLPIINGRTFEVGEEAEVPTPYGKVSIKCIQVKGDTVIVQLPNGERQELKLRGGL